MASIHDRVTDVGAYLREQRETARLSVRQLATLTGVSNPYLSQVERGLRKPSAEVLQQIAKGLRISAEALYVRAGILDEELRVGVERAVHGDPELTDRQKRVLLDIYASFRAENLRAAAEDVAASVPPRRRPSTRTTSSVPTPAKRSARTAAAADATERPARPRRRAKGVAVADPVAGPSADAAAEATAAQAVDAGDSRPGAKRATKRTAKRAAAGNAAGVARRAVKRTSRTTSSDATTATTGPTPSATTDTP